MQRSTSVRAIVAVLFLASACQTAAPAGSGCSRTADCAADLVCAFGRCRAACRQTRDCPAGSRCIASGTSAVCTFESENHCDTSVCPTPLVCQNDQCRSSCTTGADCVAGTCTMGTCDEPSNVAPDTGTTLDAGGVDGDRPDGFSTQDDAAPIDSGPIDAAASDLDGGDGACSFALGTPYELISTAGGNHLTIATSETMPGTAIVGWVHVGGTASFAGGAPTLFAATVPAANPATSMRIADLSAQTFFDVGPHSIALRYSARSGGVVDVLATFDDGNHRPAGAYTGAVGDMRLGGAPWPGILTMVQKNSWLCSLDMGPSCTDPPDARDLRPGRVLVVGGSDAASPVRYVYQSEKGAMRRLVSIAEDFSGTDRIVDVPAFFASETFVDLAGSRGRWIVVTDTTTGALQFWDTANGTLPSALARDASGRPAIASVGTDQYALAYADTAGALDVNAVSCAADCAVPPLGSETQRLVPASGASYLLPALTETPLGEVALAYVERTPGTPDVVHLEVLSSAVEPRPWSPVVAYTAGPGRAVIDVQIASAHDAHEAMIALAILEGPAGSTTGDAIWVMTAAAPDACF